jgi:ligand-binding sensor domain-containing protein
VSVFNDKDNIIWIGTTDGLIYQYNSKLKKFNRFTCFENLANIPIYNFFEDSKSNIWISTDFGLHVFNKNTKTCKIYTTENSDLSDNIIRAISEDSHGNIWVGTLVGGLCVFNDEFKLIVNYGEIYDFYVINHI